MSDHRRNSTATGKWTEMIWTPHRTEDNVTHALSLLTLFNSAFFSLSEGKCGCPGLLNPKFKRRGRRSVVCSLCVTFTPLQQRSCEGLQKENVNLWHLSLSECEPFVYILDFRLKKIPPYVLKKNHCQMLFSFQNMLKYILVMFWLPFKLNLFLIIRVRAVNCLCLLQTMYCWRHWRLLSDIYLFYFRGNISYIAQ